MQLICKRSRKFVDFETGKFGTIVWTSGSSVVGTTGRKRRWRIRRDCGEEKSVTQRRPSYNAQLLFVIADEGGRQGESSFAAEWPWALNARNLLPASKIVNIFSCQINCHILSVIHLLWPLIVFSFHWKNCFHPHLGTQSTASATSGEFLATDKHRLDPDLSVAKYVFT